MCFITLPVDHASMQYSGHGASLLVIQFQSDSLKPTWERGISMASHTLRVCNQACVSHHWLRLILFKCYFPHPGIFPSVHVSRGTICVDLSSFSLVGLHSSLFHKGRSKTKGEVEDSTHVRQEKEQLRNVTGNQSMWAQPGLLKTHQRHSQRYYFQ